MISSLSIQNDIVRLRGLWKKLSTVPPGKDSEIRSYPFLSCAPDPKRMEILGSEASMLSSHLQSFPLQTQDATRLNLRNL